MQPADDQVFISLCSQTFALKASLRAAYLLNLKYKGFSNLAKAVSEGSMTAYQDVIKAGCTDPAALQAFLRPFHDPAAFTTPLGESILANREELLEFVLTLSGAKRRDDDEPAQNSKTVSVEQFHTTLFRLGTGWLGWSPEDTWEASPNEIMEAAGGRREMLAAIFGSKRDEAETIDPKDANARAELNALGDLSVQSMSHVRKCQ
jgi:hypothetical protein